MLINDWQNVWKSYSVLTHIANLLIVISSIVLSALPTLADYIEPKKLFVAVGVLSTLGIVGRMVRQDLNGNVGKIENE